MCWQGTVRDMVELDCVSISSAFAEQGWNKPLRQYQDYWREMQQGLRTVLVAEDSGQFAGYVTIVWQSECPPFRQHGIPEIVDLNVLIKYRRRGIGSALMDAAETRVGSRSNVVGIGVGLPADYGPAQIMYVKRGYAPDGRGLCRGARQLRYGETVVVDDDLTLYFTKRSPVGSGSERGAG